MVKYILMRGLFINFFEILLISLASSENEENGFKKQILLTGVTDYQDAAFLGNSLGKTLSRDESSVMPGNKVFNKNIPELRQPLIEEAEYSVRLPTRIRSVEDRRTLQQLVRRETLTDETVHFGSPIATSLKLTPSEKCLGAGKNVCFIEDENPKELYKFLEAKFSDNFNHLSSLKPSPPSGSVHEDFDEAKPCPTQIIDVHPTWFQDASSNSWQLAWQTTEIEQIIRTTNCRGVGTACQYVMPYYNSTCQTQYILHQLISWDPNEPERLKLGYLRIEGGCVCYISTHKIIS